MVQVATAGAQAFLRLGSGAFVSGKLSPSWKRPAKPIELYEFEVRQCLYIPQVSPHLFLCELTQDYRGDVLLGFEASILHTCGQAKASMGCLAGTLTFK